MIYLEKITIKDNTYAGSQVLEKEFEMQLSDVNLFVGNQGTGKSTLLKLIQKNHSDIQVQVSEFVKKYGVNTYFFDSEKGNPRIKDPEFYTTPAGNDKGIGYGNALLTRFQSHGEVMQDIILTPIIDAKNCIILLDEPELGLSITNQFRLIERIKKAVVNGCQFFIATHCYPLIAEFDVISLDHFKQMSGKKFIKLVKNIKNYVSIN